MSILKLKSDFDTISFINDATYQLMDNTVEISPPEMEDIRTTTMRYSGRDLRYMYYKSREVRFIIRILGATDANVTLSAVRLARIINAATYETYINGGAYGQQLVLANAVSPHSDTGDHGVTLQLRLGDTPEGDITSEYSNTTFEGDNVLVARVISASMVAETSEFSSIRKDGNTYFREYEITLEIEPFFTKQSRILRTVAAPGFRGGQVQPETASLNRLIINSGEIVGDAPALTRISTQLDGGQGILIARDAGISMLNSSSFPVYQYNLIGSQKNDMYTYAVDYTAEGRTYIIKITNVSPDRFAYSTNGGSSWSSNIDIQTMFPHQLGADPVYVYFRDNNGHFIDDTWTFKNNQSYNVINTTIDAYANRTSLYGEDGYKISEKALTVPPGCYSRYKIYLLMNQVSGVLTEYSMKVYFRGYNGPSGRVNVASQNYDWVRAPLLTNYVDLGVVDLNPSTNSFLLHPASTTEILIEFYARVDAELESGDQIISQAMLLVPCQDENSYLHTCWYYDGFGREIYSNYDPANPYIAEIGKNMFDSLLSIGNLAPLDETHAGNIITLIPGLHNTLLFVPIFTTNTSDWRIGSMHANADTGATYLAIKPRFLNV